MPSSDARLVVTLAALCAGLVFGGCATTATTASATGEGVGALTLTHPDGRSASVASLTQAHAGTVFVFWAAGCPCVRRYQARVEALAQAWAGRGIAFVGVDSNVDETLEDIARARAERGISLEVWRDEGGQLARALGARSTPTVVLIDAAGAVRYRGWVDNERPPGEDGREAWLEAALEGLTAGTPFAAKSPAWGCAITRSLKSIPQCHVPEPQASAEALSSGGHP